ncbi:MalY/PatB family protein [Nocardioides yefusunii]|uniref:cysteine-S-conjugate beta-lyase n=1 Tax=Nocardioides yefusunii TaxID=2500546 RepID=A0ABW1R006_9ACTN|nr:aminotransferase class I/II-fold pyridoxal phosphate-dependent enzyme [Nocardioides yefusunii]
MSTHAWDQITVEQLRRNGGRKWMEFPDKIGAFVAEMDFGTAPEVADAIQDAVGRHHFGYAPSKAHADLADALAGWVGREFDWTVSPDAVVSVGDVLSAFAAVIEKFTAPGATVILPTPAYMPFLIIPPALGRRVEQVPMLQDAEGAWSYDFDRIEELFAAGPSLFVLCNPHNPIGKVATRAELETIAALASRHGGLVFSDEIHAGMVYEGTHVPFASISDEAAAVSITSTSASKAWNLPGLKCAQIIATNPEHAKVLKADEYLLIGGAGLLGVVANTAAYNGDQTWRRDLVTYLDGNRRALAEALRTHAPEIVHHSPAATYLAWMDCAPLGLGNPEQFFREEAGVALVAGTRCGTGYEQYARINFATPRPVLLDAVERMGAALAARS